MNIRDLLLIFTGGINLGVGLMILLRDFRNNANRLYFIFSVCMSLWALCLLIFRTAGGEVSGFFGRSSYIAGLAMSSSFYLFSQVYPYQHKELRKIELWLFAVLNLICVYVSLSTSWLIQRTTIVDGVVSAITNININIVYDVLLVALIVVGLINLGRKMKNSGSTHSGQVKRIFYVSIFAALFGIIFDVILPLYGNYSLNWLGPQFLILLSSAVGVIILEPKVTVHG